MFTIFAKKETAPKRTFERDAIARQLANAAIRRASDKAREHGISFREFWSESQIDNLFNVARKY